MLESPRRRQVAGGSVVEDGLGGGSGCESDGSPVEGAGTLSGASGTVGSGASAGGAVEGGGTMSMATDEESCSRVVALGAAGGAELEGGISVILGAEGAAVEETCPGLDVEGASCRGRCSRSPAAGAASEEVGWL